MRFAGTLVVLLDLKVAWGKSWVPQHGLVNNMHIPLACHIQHGCNVVHMTAHHDPCFSGVVQGGVMAFVMLIL